ncbi:hypothetical protein [Erwinia phage FBB1]|nr:hypothetical protein [Erwinia phage FBB1]
MNLRIVDEYNNILIEVIDIKEYEMPDQEYLYIEGKKYSVLKFFQNFEKDKLFQIFGELQTNYGESWIIYTVKEYV